LTKNLQIDTLRKVLIFLSSFAIRNFWWFSVFSVWFSTLELI